MKSFLLCLLLSLPLFGATPHPLGFRSSPHGVKAAPIETHPKFKAAPLPKSASVAQWFYRTDQGERGACVAFSGNEAVDAVYQKDHHQHVYLSFLDTYQRCLVMDGSFPNDNGTYGTTLLKVLAGGALLEKTWPYSMRLDMLPPMTKDADAERAEHATVKSYALPNNDKGRAIKECIANLQVPALIGSLWYNNGFDAKEVTCTTGGDGKSGGKKVKRFVLPYPKGQPVGGHEIPIVSYDDIMVFPTGEVGGVEIHNHWGAWGDERGCAWIPYKWAFNPRIVEDVVAIELVKKPEPSASSSPPQVTLRDAAVQLSILSQ